MKTKELSYVEHKYQLPLMNEITMGWKKHVLIEQKTEAKFKIVYKYLKCI